MSRRTLAVSTVLGAVAVLFVVWLVVPPSTYRSIATGDPAEPTGPASAGLAEAPPAASPTPTGPPGCPPFPAFPDADCTGWQHTGVELRDCPTEVTEPGATLDGCRFAGGLEINAPDVTVTRSRIEGIIQPHRDLQDLTLIDVEIDGTGPLDPNAETAIGGSNYTCIRCHIHDTGRGARMENNVHIEDSYLHDFPFQEGFHKTAIGANGGGAYTVIHNNLECSVTGCSAALSLYGDFAPVDDVLIQRNLFNTTGSYCTYGGSVSSKPYPVGTNIRYLDNRFGTKYHPTCGIYGPVTSWDGGGDGNEWKGNQWQDGSGAVKP
jgi:hypothetical protein